MTELETALRKVVIDALRDHFTELLLERMAKHHRTTGEAVGYAEWEAWVAEIWDVWAYSPAARQEVAQCIAEHLDLAPCIEFVQDHFETVFAERREQ